MMNDALRGLSRATITLFPAAQSGLPHFKSSRCELLYDALCCGGLCFSNTTIFTRFPCQSSRVDLPTQSWHHFAAERLREVNRDLPKSTWQLHAKRFRLLGQKGLQIPELGTSWYARNHEELDALRPA